MTCGRPPISKPMYLFIFWSPGPLSQDMVTEEWLAGLGHLTFLFTLVLVVTGWEALWASFLAPFKWQRIPLFSTDAPLTVNIVAQGQQYPGQILTHCEESGAPFSLHWPPSLAWPLVNTWLRNILPAVFLPARLLDPRGLQAIMILCSLGWWAPQLPFPAWLTQFFSLESWSSLTNQTGLAIEWNCVSPLWVTGLYSWTMGASVQ